MQQKDGATAVQKPKMRSWPCWVGGLVGREMWNTMAVLKAVAIVVRKDRERRMRRGRRRERGSDSMRIV